MAAVALVVLTGCSGDAQDASVKLARADVARKQAAVVGAGNAATSAATAFCSASAEYITAIDQYGDLLTQSAPTVGDVVTAGGDLDEPSAEAAAAGQDVSKSKADLASAEADLAAAEDKLADAEQAAAGETPAPASSGPSPSPSATATPASVARVQQAEQQFTAAQEGITEQTPLAQAAEQFNSAASPSRWPGSGCSPTGCIPDAQQAQAAAAVSAYTVALQQQLTDAGYYTGAVDGLYGPSDRGSRRGAAELRRAPRDRARWTRPPRRRCGRRWRPRAVPPPRPAWTGPPRCSRRSSSPATGPARSTASGPTS